MGMLFITHNLSIVRKLAHRVAVMQNGRCVEKNNAATRSLDAIWQAGHRYQKAGVMLGDFFSQGVAQLNLFDDNAPRPGSEQLMAVMDTLNAKEGRGTLYFAGQGIQQQWQMKRAMLSPCYTTRSSDLLRVK